MRKKMNYDKVTFLGGLGGNPPIRKRFVACNCCVLIWPRLKDFEKLENKL